MAPRFMTAFLSVCEWLDVYFGRRPNLRDEHYNHLIEMAVAGGASWIVTSNVADFERPELEFNFPTSALAANVLGGSSISHRARKNRGNQHLLRIQTIVNRCLPARKYR